MHYFSFAGKSNAYQACLDGALHLWPTNSNFVRPSTTIEGAHTKGVGVGIGAMLFSVDNRTLLTRGADDTVKCTFDKRCLVLH